jgi:regulator of nucleoside diphosphate kinase
MKWRNNMDANRVLIVTHMDYHNIMSLLENPGYMTTDEMRENAKRLKTDLMAAEKVNDDEIPYEYVKMHTVFELKSDGEPNGRTITLVYPEEADIEKNMVSILSPVGSAVIGYRLGDTVKWKVPAGESFLKISKILLQKIANRELESRLKEIRNSRHDYAQG